MTTEAVSRNGQPLGGWRDEMRRLRLSFQVRIFLGGVDAAFRLVVKLQKTDGRPGAKKGSLELNRESLLGSPT